MITDFVSVFPLSWKYLFCWITAVPKYGRHVWNILFFSYCSHYLLEVGNIAWRSLHSMQHSVAICTNSDQIFYGCVPKLAVWSKRDNMVGLRKIIADCSISLGKIELAHLANIVIAMSQSFIVLIIWVELLKWQWLDIVFLTLLLELLAFLTGKKFGTVWQCCVF